MVLKYNLNLSMLDAKAFDCFAHMDSYILTGFDHFFFRLKQDQAVASRLFVLGLVGLDFHFPYVDFMSNLSLWEVNFYCNLFRFLVVAKSFRQPYPLYSF